MIIKRKKIGVLKNKNFIETPLTFFKEVFKGLFATCHSVIVTRFLGMFLITTFVVSCGTTVPTSRSIGALDLTFKAPDQQPMTQYIIAIVSPEFTGRGQQTQQTANLNNNNSLAAMIMMSQMRQQQFNFSTAFSSNYQTALVNAMTDSLQVLISKKGFKTKLYSSFDEIAYQDKKTIFLASVPKLALDIFNKVSSNDCSRLHCSQKGEIQITGSLTYKLIEPMSGQTFLTRRINLSDFNISKPYIREYQTTTSGGSGITGMLLDKALAPDKVVDNTDKVLTEAINEFYALSMAKLNQFISREEIISFAPDVRELKGKVRAGITGGL